MPSITGADLTTIRQYPQTVERYLSIFPRNTVFQAQVNGTPPRDTQTGGLYQFAYDNVVTGAFTDIIVGQSIDIGTTPGARDIGTTRVRKTPTSNTIYIAETAEGKLDIEDNYYVTVKDEFRPWLKLPRLVGVKNSAGYTNSFTEYHDYDEVYSNQNTQIRPKANITESSGSRRAPRPAGWLDEGQSYRTVTLSSFYSHILANGATLSTILWDVGDGTIVSGSTSTQDITVRFPEGARYISLTITDSNSRSNTMYWPIFAHGDTFVPITAFTVTNDTRGEGREMGFEIFGEDDTATELIIPEGSVVCYWENAMFGEDEAPNQYIDQFIGWTTADSTTLKLNNSSRYRIDVGGVQTWLSQFTGFAQKVSNKTPINRWFKMSNITVDRMAHYILREYTTVLNVCNLFLTFINTQVRAEEIKKSDVWSQLTDLNKGNEYAATACDTFGSIWVVPHYSYMEIEDRTDRDIVINLDAQDWTEARGLEIGNAKLDRVSVVTGAGSFVSSNKNKLCHSKAPGLVPAMSGNDEEAPFQRLDHTATLNAQLRLNRFTGHHFARVNNPLNEISLELIGNLDVIEVGWNEPVTITWTADSIRGTVVNTEEFLVTRINVSHSNNFGTQPKRISLTLEKATVGKPGVTYIPPKTGSTLSIPQIQFPKIDFPTFQPMDWYNLPPSVPTMAVIAGPSLISGSQYYNAVYISDTNFSDAAIPSFTEYNLTPETTRAIIGFIIDPHSPYYMGTGTTVNGWTITTHNIYRHNDIFGSRTNVSQIVLTNPLVNGSVDTTLHRASRTIPGWVLFTSTSASDSRVWSTTDGGITWENNLTVPFSSPSDAFFNFIHMSEKVPGLAYIGRDLALYKTVDYGATWELINAFNDPVGGQFSGRWLHCPLEGNPQDKALIFANDGNYVIVKGAILPADETNWWYRVRDVNDIGFFTTVELPWPSPEGYGFSTFSQNEKNPGRIVATMAGGNSELNIFTSIDAGATFLRKAGVPLVYGAKYTAKNPDFFYMYGVYFNFENIFDPNNQNSMVVLSRDFGRTIEDRFMSLFDQVNAFNQKVEYVANIVGM